MIETRLTRRLLVGLLLAAGPASAQTQPPRATMTVREAHQRTLAKEVILVDIRRPEEWADTGVAEGAIRLDMTSPVFEARLAGLRAENPGKPIALICRTANRTRHVQEVLGRRGWTGIIDVRGGMLGDGISKGWLDEGLPLAK
ncbi:MAG: rhodanese-like domain-containing protein [Beijerinckiaceae bacterium]|jgi:rhodanese-related sulfurtransferase|nr:rhodanese-like domain-containing protein [Beijerinckiaceae bacterium]